MKIVLIFTFLFVLPLSTLGGGNSEVVESEYSLKCIKGTDGSSNCILKEGKGPGFLIIVAILCVMIYRE